MSHLGGYKMAIKMENVTVVLVIIAIITSASTLYYGFTVVSDLSKLTGSVADLAGSMADLATALANFENTTAADLAAIAARVTEVESNAVADDNGRRSLVWS